MQQLEALQKRRERVCNVALLFIWIFLLTFLPFAVGMLGGGQASPFPWDTFAANLRRHGFWDAMFGAHLVITTDLWIFLIPGRLWRQPLFELYPLHYQYLGRLLLFTPGNPIYRLVYHGSYDL